MLSTVLPHFTKDIAELGKVQKRATKVEAWSTFLVRKRYSVTF